ncbi:MAG: hydrogenase expression/formation protein HypE [Hyphomonadaceae bacterium]
MAKDRRPRLDIKRGAIDLSHGAGGRATAQLIEEVFAPAFGASGGGDDFAAIELNAGRVVVSTDGHVVSPLFFPGGDIGALAVNGTINDVAMAGARPLYLTAAFIIEEGFPLSELARIAQSMGRAAKAANVRIVTGDTKVVERGKGDGVFIATTGIGVAPLNVAVSGANIRPGDSVIVSGSIGDHGIAIMALREGLSFEAEIISDTAPLHGLVEAMFASGAEIRALRDPTRGGLAAVLNEFAQQSGVGFRIEEAAVPVKPAVSGACELLGLDPFNVACEGRLVAVCAASDAERLLAAMRAHALGREAAIIGGAVEDAHRFVQMKTAIGGNRIVAWLSGEQLPRIC